MMNGTSPNMMMMPMTHSALEAFNRRIEEEESDSNSRSTSNFNLDNHDSNLNHESNLESDAVDLNSSHGSMSIPDDASSAAFMSSSGKSDQTNKVNAHDIKQELSKKESEKVFRLRMMVIFVLIITALLVSSAVFMITTTGEVDEFSTQYEGAALKVIDSFENIMIKMGSVSGLGVAFTSHGMNHYLDDGTTSMVTSTTKTTSSSSSTSRWPFVSLDDFPPKARNVLQLSGALMVGMCPVITTENFAAWEAYVQQPANQQFIYESIAYQKELGLIKQLEFNTSSPESSVEQNHTVYPMHYFDENGQWVFEEPGEEWYLPMWQTSPYIHEGLVNDNLVRNTAMNKGQAYDIARHVLDTGKAVVGSFFMAPPGTVDSPDPDTALLATFRSIQAKTDTPYLGDPMSTLYIPIFDSFHQATKKVVGIMTALIHWKSYFSNTLPQNIRGIVVVMEYDCGDTFVPDTTADNRRRHRRTKATTSTSTKARTASRSTSVRGQKRELGSKLTTFTIIDVSEFETVAPTEEAKDAVDYWGMPNGGEEEADDAKEGTQQPAAVTLNPEEEQNMDYWEIPQEQGEGGDEEEEDQVLDYWEIPDVGEDDKDGEEEEETTDGQQQTNVPEPTNEGASIGPDSVGVNQTNDVPENDSSDLIPPTNITGYNTDNAENETGSLFFTYIIEGADAHAVGDGDLHDSNFDDWVRVASLSSDRLDDGTLMGVPIDQSCSYTIHVYPSQDFYNEYITTTPLIITSVIVAVFVFAIAMFLIYNRMVERRQRKILKQATQSTAIVSSLFPKNVRDRLLEGGTLDENKLDFGTKSRLKGFMAGETNEDNDTSAAPIADLFPHCTVFFADIAGFTAWSSTREPSQVFVLLQNLYQAMDQLAKRRHVFKVETIGDCYMAATGLPEPQDSHASIMVRFAYDSLLKMKEITKKLESSLGPDTTELSLRIGLHSGPVTGGVLRGDRARFQLFGDTVNTASRMESTGEAGMIQVSEATANLLIAADKEHWLTPREDAIKAKGKGVLRTFWANPKNRYNSVSHNGSSSYDQEEQEAEEEEKATPNDILHQAQARLVDWIVKLMLDDIKKLVYARKKANIVSKNKSSPSFIPPDGTTCMDEVKEVIHMPKFDEKNGHHQTGDYKLIEIDSGIIQLLGEYVAAIASKYRQNPFHNFEHACHVTMSVNKLLRRIVSPELSEEQIEKIKQSNEAKLAMHLHDYTYGINSDPLAMFAMTFSALIHDVDHRGVSNMQLAVEAPKMAEKYHKKSIAEQNSLDLAWDILMEDRFSKLRSFLFISDNELLRFRQLIVNVVLATDIFDKELNDLRKNRWKRAFSGEVVEDETQQNDLRATIVIEHIIQASDVSHTMQHWHVYQKWNKCLFKEMYAAYKTGRLAKDPATFWYKGEIGFFDNYIIPLAKKLKDCGVFGVSSDEYLNYAVQNRAEWEERGQEIVLSMVQEAEVMLGITDSSKKDSTTKGEMNDGSKRRNSELGGSSASNQTKGEKGESSARPNGEMLDSSSKRNLVARTKSLSGVRR